MLSIGLLAVLFIGVIGIIYFLRSLDEDLDGY